MPEGFSIRKAGVIVTTNSEIGTSNENFTAEKALLVRGDEWSGTSYRYTWTGSGISEGMTVYVRAYLVYEDLDGNTCTVYGDIVSQTME